MVKQQCLFGTLLSIKVPGRHFLVPESWRKGVKMTEPNRQSGEKEERIIEIEIERLRPFKEHPFQVKDDKEMFLLQESIEKYGILNPLIVRPVPDLIEIRSDLSIFIDQFSEVVHVCNNFNLVIDLL